MARGGLGTPADRLDEGPTANRSAGAIRRQLATANPAPHESDLTQSHNNLSIHLTDANRRDEAE